jgi:hypothetical protein
VAHNHGAQSEIKIILAPQIDQIECLCHFNHAGGDDRHTKLLAQTAKQQQIVEQLALICN